MSFHWIGALLIVLGSGMEGFRRAYLLQKRQLLLIEFAQSFTWMQNEIVKRQTPIIDIIHAQIKRKGDTGHLYSLFLENLTVNQALLGEAWKQSTEQYGKKTSVLFKEDLEWISRAGEAIQAYDRQSIDRELSFIIEILRSRHQEARNRAVQFGKVYKTLGVMGGVLVVLLLS
ncbi:stage III sporulation protein AB [Jeotgalibacillus proteolyticus]|uniref:Stage III sporulation protein SpoAB n=1 Tax=Jeotgalibacillus proteolyticus TaxID=2082395 RepID=A0A2S5GEG6_9BACL|nr:stage III sporulation protein AB [Jeotgalibacillus proteolyticus]PPA71379.1 hypothetical protein C4B60_04765 [Jeotgalibacillus proteolyticus]